MKRFWETGKTVLIFALIASAVFLAGKTGYFDEFIDSAPVLSPFFGWMTSLKSASTPAPRDSEISLNEAARPVYAVVTGVGGHHYGIKYDGAQLSAFYSDTANILGEALGSSSRPLAITEGAWRSAITSAGIYFDYLSPIPLSALAGWLLGSDMNHTGAEHSVRRICISGSADRGVYLYYIASDGGFYRSETAVPYSSLAARMSDYLPNSAHYAFELGREYKNVDPYAIILPGTDSVPSASSSNPMFDKIDTRDILVGFEINPHLSSPYNESTGAVVYVADNCSLRLYPSGLAVYKATGDTGGRLKIDYSGGAPEISELLEGARAFVSPLIGSAAGAAELYYTGHTCDESDGGCVLTFDYFINGIPVRPSASSHAASVKISGGVITEARLCFRTFASVDGRTTNLPDLQAAALIGEEGGEPVLEYHETSDEVLTTKWTLR